MANCIQLLSILQMVEVMEGSGVFRYPQQRAYCSAFKSWPGYINAAIDIFFTKETLAVSNAKGNDRKSKNGDVHKPMTAMIIDALKGKLGYILLTFIAFSKSSLGLSFRLGY